MLRLSIAVLGLLVAVPAFSAEAEPLVALAKKVVPSVVNIQTLSNARSPRVGRGTPDDLFRRFFEDYLRQHSGRGDPDEEDEGDGEPGPGGPRAMSLGTGFIIDASGLILTNNHVVAEADEIKIMFTEDEEEKPTDGEVVGRDQELDLALIKVKSARALVPATLGDSDALEVGQAVIAVGNPFGQGHSVTHGIISAKARKAPEFMLANYLQTDAPINPGNSGGPLLNMKGEVIGINNAIDQRAQGIGFAIPINLVKKVLPQLKSKGMVSRGYIGVAVNELTPELAAKMGFDKELRAPIVTQVYPGEPAEKAGIKAYDAILEFGDRKIKSAGELIAAVTAFEVGQKVDVKISRAGKEKSVSLIVGQRPSSQPEPKKAPSKKKDKKPARIETGMDLDELTPEIARELGINEKTRGVVVSGLAYEGPAAQAGLIRGDIILEVDRKSVKTVEEFYATVKARKSYLLRVRRADPSGREAYSVVILDLKKG